jgi:hypothetical protein
MMEIPLRGVPIQGEYIMGRPIQKRWFGPTTLGGNQIVVSGAKFRDGSTVVSPYIVSQTGSAAYMIQSAPGGIPTGPSEICFMVNADSVGALLPSQCYITATPFGGTPLPCETIAQYRVSLYLVPNSVPTQTGAPATSPIGSYRWSLIPPVAPGQAALNLA